MAERLETRLKALERRSAYGGATLKVCFAEAGETREQSIARTWPNGLPLGARVLCVSWMGEEA